jgi:uncharacterized Ntn-hydrolase superfamily protein
MLKLNTFSIAARCERTGQFGVAVSTKLPAVGMLCPFARSGVGAVATQSFVNPYLGIWGLDLLAEGRDAGEVKEALLERDPDPAKRQFTVVDRWGNSAAYTGEESDTWRGDLTGENFAVAGNMLVGEEILQAMAESFRKTEERPLVERLLLALQAGQDAGGDKRGRQSAAVKVVDREEYPYLDLRVDEHPDPVPELRRVYEVAQGSLIPLISMMPTRENPAGNFDFEEARRKGLLQDQ